MNAVTELPMVMSGLVDVSRGDDLPQLLGSHCAACDHYRYPVTEHCPECGAAMATTSLGSSGVIYSHTTVRVKPPLGLPRPYSVAYIDLDDAPLRIYGLLDTCGDTPYSIGQPVHLKVGELGVMSDGQPCRRPFFSPSASHAPQEF